MFVLDTIYVCIMSISTASSLEVVTYIAVHSISSLRTYVDHKRQTPALIEVHILCLRQANA